MPAPSVLAAAGLVALLAQLPVSPPGAIDARARATVESYLHALASLDHERAIFFLAPDAVVRGSDGRETQVDREAQKRFREFERATNTRWTSSILGADGEEVAVLLTERNDFYDLLGVGLRTQVTVYGARDGKIVRMETKVVVQERGVYRRAFEAFRTWLLVNASPRDPQLLDESGGLVFDGTSAPKMLAWLHKWRAEIPASR